MATDHKAEAEMLYDSDFGSVPNQLGFETADAQHILNMLGALTQATLYAAEQQRIANLLEVARGRHDDLTRALHGADIGDIHNNQVSIVEFKRLAHEVDVLIREGLGL